MSSYTKNSMRTGETWRVTGMVITALLMLVFVMYLPTIAYLTGLWNQTPQGDYGHGYLVLMISVYLIFYNRQKLALLSPCLEYKAIVAVVMASMIWLVAALVYIEMLQTVGLLLLLLSLVWLIFGTPAMRILAFPVLFIGFAAPVWFPLSPILQEVTADVVFLLIRSLEIPALRIENMITLPAGKLSVEEACGGLNYLLAAMTLATLYAYLNYKTLRSRLVVVLVAATSAVLVNILRVFIVVYLGYVTDMQHPLIANHLSLGWYLFAGLVVVLLVFDSQRQKLTTQRAQQYCTHSQQPAVIKQTLCNKGKLQFAATFLMAAVIVSAGPITVYWLSKQTLVDSDATPLKLMSVVGEWSVVNSEKNDWMPLYRGAIAHKVTFDNQKGQLVYFYMGVYQVQKQGEELINDLNRISDETIWYSGYQRAKLLDVGGRPVLEQLLQKKDGSQRLVWYWYHVAGKNTVNVYQAKALQVLGLMKGIRRASVIAVSSRLNGSVEDARKILRQFAEDASPSIEAIMAGENNALE